MTPLQSSPRCTHRAAPADDYEEHFESDHVKELIKFSKVWGWLVMTMMMCSVCQCCQMDR
jgi:hypothetical protein